MAKRLALRGSDLTPKAKQKAAAAFSSAHDLGSSWANIADDAGLSAQTVQTWASTDMSLRAQHDRHCRSGRPPQLIEDEEAEILRRAREQREAHGVVDTAWTRAMIADVTANRLPSVSDSFISRFWRRMDWPTRRAQARSAPEVRDTLAEEAAQFQESVQDYVRSRDIPPDRVYVADETGMWNGSVALRTKVDPLTMDAGVLQQGDKQRDTGIVALSATEQIDAEFLAHQREVTRKRRHETVVVRKGISGMGSEQMLKWSEGFVARHGDEGESVLIMDRLGAHRNH